MLPRRLAEGKPIFERVSGPWAKAQLRAERRGAASAPAQLAYTCAAPLNRWAFGRACRARASNFPDRATSAPEHSIALGTIALVFAHVECSPLRRRGR
jgi:hypothetical protein